MSASVTLIDYGIGNLLNTVRALEYCGASVQVVDKASPQGANAERLILPGVGAFGDGMRELQARGFYELVKRFAQTGRPFLGICVGMQMMFDASEEMGEHAGLGLIGGRVRAVPATGTDGAPHRVPHIGWRPLRAVHNWDGTILSRAAPGDRVYFVHSFSAHPVDDKVTMADVGYDGLNICAAVHHENLYGCQFHPERSAETGLDMLRQFLTL